MHFVLLVLALFVNMGPSWDPLGGTSNLDVGCHWDPLGGCRD